MRINTIPFTLHGIEENLTVEYVQGTDPKVIGYDALQGFPIDKICCTGYPVMHGYFEHMNATGYRRSCGFIQFVERIENHGENRDFSIDVSDESLEKGNHKNRLEFLAGYSWGYEEDENGPQRLLPLEILTKNDWKKHIAEKAAVPLIGGVTTPASMQGK